MANPQKDLNTPAQPGERDPNRDMNDEQVRGLGEDSDAAEEEDEFEDTEDAEDEEEEEGEGSF